MAKVKPEKRERASTEHPLVPACETEPVLDPADFELDEGLRKLRLDQWFATVEEGMPLWVC